MILTARYLGEHSRLREIMCNLHAASLAQSQVMICFAWASLALSSHNVFSAEPVRRCQVMIFIWADTVGPGHVIILLRPCEK